MNKLLTILVFIIGGIPALALLIAWTMSVVDIAHGAEFIVEVVENCSPVMVSYFPTQTFVCNI